MDAMRSMDVLVKRVPRSCARHVSPVHVLVTCYHFAYSYVSVPISRVSLLVPIWTVNSSMLTPLSYAYFF